MKQLFTSILFVLILVSCHSNDSGTLNLVGYEGESVLAKDELISVLKDKPSDQSVSRDSKLIDKKKIIKDGSIGLRVTDLSKAKLRIDTLIKHFGGYYSNENFTNSSWESSYVLKIRVPNDHFEQLILSIENGRGEVQYKEIDARDVTDQFVDLEIRLRNKRNYLEQYNVLLKKANKIKDILEIQEKIRGLEEEIESSVGRLKYLNDQVDYSTLNLTISKHKEFKYNSDKRGLFGERLKQSMFKGWFGFVDFLLFVIRLWPLGIIVFVIIYFWLKLKNRRKK